VQLEAGALDPLHRELLALDRLGHLVAERQAEQRQAFLEALAVAAVELQPAGLPGPPDLAADVMAGLGEEAAAVFSLALGEGEPVAALLLERVHADPAQQHVVGAGVLGVQLQAGTLEPLSLDRPVLDLLLVLRPKR
jgi:hypothetical protein